MRTLKYAILGLLTEKSMTGYDLLQYFESTLNEFWSAKHSQIYPELKKLTSEGMITFEEIEQTSSPNKKVYTITKAGRIDFKKWLTLDEDPIKTPKDPFRLRVFFMHQMSCEERLELLESHLEDHKKRLEKLEHNGEKFEKKPQPHENEFGDYLVLQGAIMREKTTIDWLKMCIREIK